MNFKQRLKNRAVSLMKLHAWGGVLPSYFKPKAHVHPVNDFKDFTNFDFIDYASGVSMEVPPSTYALSKRFLLDDGPEGFVKPIAFLHSNGKEIEVPCELCYQPTPDSYVLKNKDGLYITPPMEVFVGVTAGSNPADYIQWFFIHGNKRYGGIVKTNPWTDPLYFGNKPLYPEIITSIGW